MTRPFGRYWDEEYRKHVQYYDRRRLEFRRDSAVVWQKLIELGCEGRPCRQDSPFARQASSDPSSWASMICISK